MSARRPISGGQPSPLPAEARRAPTEAEWAALDEAQRRQVEEELWESDSVEQQEAEYKEAMAESERHLDAKVEARDTLREFFRQQRPNLFIAAELPVYYPGQKPIRPDLIAVVDVDPSGERAACHSYFTVFQGLPDFPLQAIISGRYVDTFERVDGRWRFAERRMTPWTS